VVVCIIYKLYIYISTSRYWTGENCDVKAIKRFSLYLYYVVHICTRTWVIYYVFVYIVSLVYINIFFLSLFICYHVTPFQIIWLSSVLKQKKCRDFFIFKKLLSFYIYDENTIHLSIASYINIYLGNYNYTLSSKKTHHKWTKISFSAHFPMVHNHKPTSFDSMVTWGVAQNRHALVGQTIYFYTYYLYNNKDRYITLHCRLYAKCVHRGGHRIILNQKYITNKLVIIVLFILKTHTLIDKITV